ncbi:AraC-like ligand-binding domain-containing protein [Streptomyces sp. NPDC055607]
MSPVLTTASVPDRDKVAYWNDAVSRTLVPVTVTPRGDGPFEGRITADRLGHLRVSTVEADAGRTSRTPALIAGSSGASGSPVAVGVQVSGTAVFAQDGRRTELGAGDLVVYDTARPYSFDHPRRFALHVFQFPRHALGVSDHDLRQVTGRAVGTGDGFGATLFPFLVDLASSPADGHPPAVANWLAGHVVDLFATLITERARPEETDADARSRLMMRVLDHINRNLGDPDLSPERIAREHRISVRYLHRLFEGEGTTVGRLVKQRRLEECGRELARPGGTAPTVAAVAQRWGFVSPAHFSRAFRAAYGVSPREWRGRHAAGDGLVRSPVSGG